MNAGSCLAIAAVAGMSVTPGLCTANAAVIRPQDETTRSVLDIFA